MRRSDDQALPSAGQIGPVLSELLSVANIAALAPLTYGDGTAIFVRSVRDFWVYRAGSTATADAITVVAHASGTGRWERLCIAHPSWVQQAAWVITPSTGDDENEGGSGAPLRTAAELERRLCPSGTYGSLLSFTTITITESLPDTDSITLRLAINSPTNNAAALAVLGTIGAPHATGTLLTYTPLNRATHTLNKITASGITWASHVGRRITLTSGAFAGYHAVVVAATGGAGGTEAEISSWCQPQGSITSSTIHAVPTLNPAIAGTETFEISNLTSLGRRARISFKSSVGSLAAFGNCITFFKDVLVPGQNLANSSSAPFLECLEPSAVTIWNGCDIQGLCIGAGLHRFYGCHHGGGKLLGNATFGNVSRFVAGAVCRPDGAAVSMQINGPAACLDGDIVLHKCQLDVGGGSGQTDGFVSSVTLGNVCVRQATGSGILVRPRSFVRIQNGLYSGHNVWGNGNTTYGIEVKAGALVVYEATKPTVTGATNDTLIGGAVTAYAGVPVVTAANQAAIVLNA